MGLKIASRKSDLARLQAYQVGDALLKAHPDLSIQYEFRSSLGDINQEDPLWKMPEKGVFTEDFREGLLKGQWDMVVHSWKDLPTDIPSGSEIVATLPRADMRDLFLFKKKCWQRVKDKKQLRVFTSSPRRIYNLEKFFKKYLPTEVSQVVFEPVRGNIATRIGKMLSDESIDGLIVAKAALDRLLSVDREEFDKGKRQLREWLQETSWMVLPLSLNPAAAAQGALAVEVAGEREDLKEALQKIHCSETWETVQHERKILKSYGGGCHQKIGVSCLKRDYGEVVYLQGLTDQGEKLDSIRLLGAEEGSFSSQQSFPLDPGKGSWFKRQAVDYQRPSGHYGHFVARANAVPDKEEFAEGDIVWASGLKTWQKLAQRGLWVHGSSESLGEREDKRLKALAGDLSWLKWTHTKAQASQGGQVLATYQLVPGEKLDIQGKENFYWMSGSSFEQALACCPEIVDKVHYCGPGNTHDTIKRILHEAKGAGQVRVALSFEHWKQFIEE